MSLRVEMEKALHAAKAFRQKPVKFLMTTAAHRRLVSEVAPWDAGMGPQITDFHDVPIEHLPGDELDWRLETGEIGSDGT